MQSLHTSRPAGRAAASGGAARSAQRTARYVGCSASASQAQQQALKVFPSSYDAAIRQAQEATKAAVADGHTLLEVEFPSSSITAVQGDGEGQNEMNASMGYLRQYLNAWRDNAGSIRVFFPDNIEVAVARSGQTEDPAAGRVSMDPKFGDDTKWKMGYLTKQTAAWAMFGRNMGGFNPAQLVQDTDEMFVVAYPSFNPREELTATMSLYMECCQKQGRPMVVFNGELDRMRGGYFPALFFPELAKVTNELMPLLEGAYYIRNIKGSMPGALFRAYPGPWQVLRRSPIDDFDMRVVWTGDERPTLKQVALEILPNS